MTNENLTKTTHPLDRLAEDLEEGSTLHHYAAADAAKVLVANWKDALCDNPPVPLTHLANDIDEVISLLLKFKFHVLVGG